MSAPDWSGAACATKDGSAAELFAPGAKGDRPYAAAAIIERYCDRCPIVAACGEFAEAHRLGGIWGGEYRRLRGSIWEAEYVA